MLPIRAVLFDFHSTLVDQGDAADWVAAAETEWGAPIPAPRRAELVGFLDRVWDQARRFDPDSERDISPDRHREIFETVISRAFPDFQPVLVDALYATLLSTWTAYDDAVDVVGALRSAGIKTAIVSNAGIDVRPVVRRTGLAGVLDAVVISGEVGHVKPGPEIFQRALDELGVAAEDALMVGDSWHDDGGGAGIGIRTLLLPRTRGRVHGLDAVLALTGTRPVSPE